MTTLASLTPQRNSIGKSDGGTATVCATIIVCLCRDVCLLEQELVEKVAREEKLKQDLEAEKRKVPPT